MDRYIFREMVTPFILGLVMFTFVLILNRIFKLTDLIVTKGVSVWVILKLFTYILPSMLTLTIPMSLLLAALVAFSRLSTDSEIIAMKANGFSLYRLVVPVVAFSLITLTVTSYFSLYLAPLKASTFKKDLFILAKTRAAVGIEEEVFNDTFKNLVIYTQDMPTANEMSGVFISDERNPKEPYVVIAERGMIDIDPSKGYAYLTLKNGSIHKKGSKPGSYQEIEFQRNIVSIALYEGILNEKVKRSKREMSLVELKEEHDRMKERGSIHQYSMMTEYYQRFAIPLACIVFGLVGPPLGLYSRRSGKSSGITMALAVFALYYVLMEGAENVANEGKMPPLVAALAPNLLLGAGAAYILVRSANERQINPQHWLYVLKRRWDLSRSRSRRRKRKKRG